MSDRLRLLASAAVITLVGGCAGLGGLGDTDANQRGDASDTSAGAETTAQASSSGDAAAGTTQQASSSGDADEDTPFAFSDGTFEPTQATEIQPTDTFVGQKVAQFSQELQELKSNLGSHNERLQQLRQQARERAQSYQDRIARITARLQTGTTPGNPELVELWEAAQSDLEQMQEHISALNTLSNQVSGDAALAAYLLDSVRAAYALSGAVEQDHEHLELLEDEVNRTVVRIERLASQVSEDVNRNNRYLQNERSNLRTLSLSVSRGELLGGSAGQFALDGQAAESPTAQQQAAAGQAPSARRFGEPQLDQRVADQPLVRIRFEDPTVDFAQPLYDAVSQALDRRPQANFELVAVAPDREQVGQASLARSQTRQHAERVRRTLIDMGMPQERLVMTETRGDGIQSPEVQVYGQ